MNETQLTKLCNSIDTDVPEEDLSAYDLTDFDYFDRPRSNR